MKSLLWIAAVLTLNAAVEGFVVKLPPTTNLATVVTQVATPPPVPVSFRTDTALSESEQPPERKADPGGNRRGAVLLTISLLVCIWSFSIPPEFRRARFCPTEACVETRCFDCVTSDEWTAGIADYYKNTPPAEWIKFDFTIDQATKDFWAGN